MEIGNIHNPATQKAEELREARPVSKRAAQAYSQVERKDSVDVSSKAKLLHRLRESYDKLPDAKTSDQVKELQAKMEEGVHKLSSEEIVSSILKGTLFDIV